MSRNRFVEPKTVRLELSDGDWVEVKARLTYGEEQRLASAGLTSVKGARVQDATVGIDLERYNLAKLEVWLVDWSFRDARDKPAKLTRSAIAALDPDTAEEIMAALDAHIERLDDEKKALSGKSEPVAK